MRRKSKAIGCGMEGGCVRDYIRVLVLGVDRKVSNSVDR